MSRPQANLILAAAVLLACPWLLPGGRAEANFTLDLSARAARSPGSLPKTLSSLLHDEDAEPDAAPSSVGMGETSPAHPPGDLPPELFLFCDRCPARATSPTGGASSSGSSPTGSGSGAGLPFIFFVDPRVPDADVAGRLFLGDEQFKLPPFCARLFRPPRVPAVPAES